MCFPYSLNARLLVKLLVIVVIISSLFVSTVGQNFKVNKDASEEANDCALSDGMKNHRCNVTRFARQFFKGAALRCFGDKDRSFDENCWSAPLVILPFFHIYKST